MKEPLPFGEWLRKQRRAMDVSRQDLADQAGCAEVTLRRIEAGTLKPSKELAAILLEKVGIPQHEHEQWVRFARGQSGMPLEQSTSESRPHTNLPAPLTSFIGRGKEQAKIIQLVHKHRLVTLTGPGGVGKTRLSLKASEQMLADYPNGIWLVELAPLNDPVLLPETVTAVFGVTSQSNIPITEILINFLRAKQTLLILDNCEHLLDACAQLADTLLKHCPHLKILATSREALDILGEATYQVPPLGLPDAEKLLDQFREFESVSLFEERAQLVQTDFRLTMDKVTAVAQICTHLDGIPLAIELAAVHVRLLSPAEIAAQLDHSFDVLTGGNRTALPRQQTIRASVDWSWNLLTAHERNLLRRLSIFAGGWTLASAQAVCQDAMLSDSQIRLLMAQLVSKSLVGVNQPLGLETRYYFHEIIRQYAREKLMEAGEVVEVRTRHLRYFEQLAEQAETALRGPEQVAWGQRLSSECDNIRAALEWADQTNGVEAGLWIAGRLMRQFWYDFNRREGERWLRNFLERPTSHSFPQARARALSAYGYYTVQTGQLSLLEQTAEECLALYRAISDPHGEIEGLIMLSRVIQAKDRTKSIDLCQQALALAKSLGDTWRSAIVLTRLGFCHECPQRISYWQEAITLFRQVGDLRSLETYLGRVADYELLAGDIASAEAHLDEAVQLNRILKHKRNIESIFIPLSRLESIRGNFQKARALLEKGIADAAEFGPRMSYLGGLAHLGHLMVYQGQLAEARGVLRETTLEFLKYEDKMGVCYSLEGMAAFYVAMDRPAIGIRLIGWADATRKKINDNRLPLEQANVDKLMVACLARMGEATFAAAYPEGQKMTLEQAIELALEETHP